MLKHKSKRELLQILSREVAAWDGWPLKRRQDRRLQRIMRLLWRCHLTLMERLRVELCDIWLTRAGTKELDIGGVAAGYHRLAAPYRRGGPL